MRVRNAVGYAAATLVTYAGAGVFLLPLLWMISTSVKDLGSVALFPQDRDEAKLVLRPKQEQLLHLLREHKALKPREIWDGIGVSKQGALDLLRPLIKAGLVRRIGTKKSGRYVLK